MALDDANEERKERRKRKRWGDRPAVENTADGDGGNGIPPPLPPPAVDSMDPKARILAIQESVRARLAAAKAQQATTAASSISGILKRPADVALTAGPQPVKRAKVYELDLSVTAPTFQDDRSLFATAVKSASLASKVLPAAAAAAPAVAAKPSNPYLAYQGDEEDQDDDAIDNRLQRASKPRKRHKEITFVEPGKWQEIAATKREKELKAAASGYTSGRKAGHTIRAPTLSDIYTGAGDAIEDDSDRAPRADAHPDTKMPIAMEWWDTELLPSKLKRIVAAEESKALTQQTTALNPFETTTTTTDEMGVDDNGYVKDAESSVDAEANELESLRTRCFQQASLSYCKTAALVQHIVPVKPPNADAAPKKQQVLHLTKKELKRQRKLRRQEKQRELQDLQAAGLIPAPEPRLTLRNFIQVLGDQAFLDPSQIEQKVQEQVQARQRTHLERNEAAKLTKEQRAAKLARKYEEDTTTSDATALFFVKDMSHPYHRTKVDLNAQQLNLSGCVLECAQDPSCACVVVEGGPKAIKRFSRLMLVRMKWTGPENSSAGDDDEGGDGSGDDTGGDVLTHPFNRDNTCDAVWQGMAVRRLFHGFLFQACETHDQARKILKAKGASHYWDQVLQRATGQSGKFQLKLAQRSDDDDDDDDDDPFQHDEEDLVMKDA